MKKRSAVALSFTIALVGCATASKDVVPTYISPMQYQPYTCEQLVGEAQRLQVRVNQLGGRLDEHASNDKMIASVGWIVWPSLFALGHTGAEEAEYARLSGEYNALQQSAIDKKCPAVVAPTQSAASPNKTIESSPKP